MTERATTSEPVRSSFKISKELTRVTSGKGRKELERLLRRLAVLGPIVREQRSQANRKAEDDYFGSADCTDEERYMWQRSSRCRIRRQ